MEAGLLEIHRFLSPSLLEPFDLEHMPLEEFLRWVAKARYVEELEQLLMTRAIADAFAEEDET